eukprot:3135680-Prorocentrum_lima.AAC.1
MFLRLWILALSSARPMRREIPARSCYNNLVSPCGKHPRQQTQNYLRGTPTDRMLWHCMLWYCM